MSEHAPIQGVNIDLGDEVSEMLYEASKLTYENRPGFLVELHESFSGFRAIPGSVLNDVDNLYFNLGFDGVGTKVEISERLEDHSLVAHDLFAMVCDDAIVRGAEPVAIGSILDIRQWPDDEEYAREVIGQLAQGYIAASRAAGVIVVNGEVAELGDRVGGYGDFNYNWGAAVLWIAHKDRVLTGHQIRPGDTLVGFAERGFRSNGITDVRKAMHEHYGPEWHNEIDHDIDESATLGELIQQPSTIYSKFFTQIMGGFDVRQEPQVVINGLAHITGGGQPSKLARMLEPSGYGATIDTPIEPPRVMTKVQEVLGLSDIEAYGKHHKGPGMIAATPDPETLKARANAAGFPAEEIGKITEEPGIRIKNCGAQQKEEWLIFK